MVYYKRHSVWYKPAVRVAPWCHLRLVGLVMRLNAFIGLLAGASAAFSPSTEVEVNVAISAETFADKFGVGDAHDNVVMVGRVPSSEKEDSHSYLVKELSKKVAELDDRLKVYGFAFFYRGV